jgi:hypothetical protein
MDRRHYWRLVRRFIAVAVLAGLSAFSLVRLGFTNQPVMMLIAGGLGIVAGILVLLTVFFLIEGPGYFSRWARLMRHIRRIARGNFNADENLTMLVAGHVGQLPPGAGGFIGYAELYDLSVNGSKQIGIDAYTFLDDWPRTRAVVFVYRSLAEPEKLRIILFGTTKYIPEPKPQPLGSRSLMAADFMRTSVLPSWL